MSTRAPETLTPRLRAALADMDGMRERGPAYWSARKNLLIALQEARRQVQIVRRQ
jgi:hypothetical protein